MFNGGGGGAKKARHEHTFRTQKTVIEEGNVAPG